MLTLLNPTAVWATLRIPALVSEIPPIFVAEHLRAVASGLYAGEPLTVQRLVAMVEPKLRPIGYRPQNIADECFGAESAGTSSIADIIADLAEIGDFVRASGGACWPAETRFVRLAPQLTLIASALPTGIFSQQRVNPTIPALTRLISTPPANVPEQSLSSWLGVKSADYGRFADRKINAYRPHHNGSAQGWTFYDTVAGVWRDVRESSTNKLVALCRFRPDGIPYFQYGIGELRKSHSSVSCTSLLEINTVDARRVICGLHINAGTKKKLTFKKHENWYVTNIAHYDVPELSKVLRAISADAECKADKRTDFWVSEKLETSLEIILAHFGRTPVFR